MHILESLVLGVVQGLTEWLPISSTAHLKIIPALLHWNDPGAANTAVLQLGTLLAVLIYFRKELLAMTKALFHKEDTPEKRMAIGVLLGTIPICLIALKFKDYIKGPLRDNNIIGIMLIVMGIVLFLADRFSPKKRTLNEVTIKDGLIVGAFQCIALVPGASRSGSTLVGAFIAGLDREAAAKFSFLLSVPAVLISGLYELKDVIKPEPLMPGSAPLMALSTTDIAIATVVSGIVGYASIAFLMKFLKTNNTTIFVVYRILAGALLLYLVAKGFVPAK